MRHRKMHYGLAAPLISFCLSLPLYSFAANDDAIDSAHKTARIPWIKPSIPLNTTLKSNSAILDKPAPKLTSADLEKLKLKQAFAAMQNTQFMRAIELYQSHIDAYPNSKYAAASHYWIGEACRLSKDYNGALEAFSQVMIYYPNSREAEEAALKSGQVFYAMSNWPRAQKSLHHVVSTYPHSITAKKAQNYLKLIKKNAPITNS